MKFKIVNPEIETVNTENLLHGFDVIVFTLKTPLGELEFLDEFINTDENGNKTVERTDSSLRCDVYNGIDELFEYEIPWTEIYDALDSFLEKEEY